MDYVRFGQTDFQVSRMGLGCMSMSGAYGPADDPESIATLHRAFDLGVNFLDTSSNYGNGHNHQLIAKAIRGRRERIIIHSKSGGPQPANPEGWTGGSPAFLIRSCEETLTRLGTDVLDIYCMSRVDLAIPIEESVGAMARLVQQGKVRHLALSEASAASIQRAQQVHPIVSLQMEYSVWSRDPEAGNLQACREYGMGFMAYSPLGRGFLTGALHNLADLPEGDSRLNSPRYQPANFEHNLTLLGQIEELARRKAATPAQLALAWLLAQGNDVIPIPSNKSQTHLEENIKALELRLTAEDMARIDAILPPGAAAGARTSDMSRVNV